MIVLKRIVVTLRECEDGWVATSNQVPELYVVSASRAEACGRGVAEARKLYRRVNGEQITIRCYEPKNGENGAAIKVSLPKLEKPKLLDQARATLDGQYHIRKIDGVDRYIVDGKFLTIPQFIARAGFQV